MFYEKNKPKETYLKTAKSIFERKKKTKEKQQLSFHPFISDTKSPKLKLSNRSKIIFTNKTGVFAWKI